MSSRTQAVLFIEHFHIACFARSFLPRINFDLWRGKRVLPVMYFMMGGAVLLVCTLVSDSRNNDCIVDFKRSRRAPEFWRQYATVGFSVFIHNLITKVDSIYSFLCIYFSKKSFQTFEKSSMT